MRRKDRAVTDPQEILKIVSKCDICRLAMVDQGKPYMVPMNFGFDLQDNTLTLTFHSAYTGRKIDILYANPEVCFEMDCEHALIEGPHACDYSFAFSSVIGTGKVEFVTIYQEKEAALALLMKQQTGSDKFTFSPKEIDNIKVMKIVTKDFSVKRKAGRPQP
jgi:nitroimidazol reductase NimA-like FMN-containing flavoprotein (pyridoxamine 5'-phosphate oxidase superfamily)